MFQNEDPYSVQGVTSHIKNLLENDDVLADVWVVGEISNLKIANSGHWYFTLKDDKAQLRSVMFKFNAMRQRIRPQDGDRVRVHGKISLYEQRGEYQLYADKMETEGGVGDLYLQFEQLKKKLTEEGLFDDIRKQAIPALPKTLGIVTSLDAAAFRDVINVLTRRFPQVNVILSPTLVQGHEAPAQIIHALNRLIQYGEVDTILMVRGGGSIEDLWGFNDEGVARAVAECAIPIVTGVGHETDFTIVDFVSDYRAPTPSAAAEISTPDGAQLEAYTNGISESLRQMIQAHIQTLHDNVLQTSKDLAYQSPQATIGIYHQRLDDISERMTQQVQQTIALSQERLARHEQALELANPTAILKRGYAIIRSKDGQIIRSADDAPQGTDLIIQLSEDQLNVQVKGEE